MPKKIGPGSVPADNTNGVNEPASNATIYRCLQCDRGLWRSRQKGIARSRLTMLIDGRPIPQIAATEPSAVTRQAIKAEHIDRWQRRAEMGCFGSSLQRAPLRDIFYHRRMFMLPAGALV